MGALPSKMELSRIAPAPDVELTYVQKELEASYQMLRERGYREDGYPLLCEIHRVFTGEPYTPSFRGVIDHNCLGCNFADSVHTIDSYLKTYNQQETIQHSFSIYLILLYLLVERMDTVFDIIQLHPEVRSRDFHSLSVIRKWANFIKHPKAFILCHHPVFTTLHAPKYKALHESASLTINTAFLQKYYTGDTHNSELYTILQNKECVLVVFPDAAHITESICSAMAMFLELLKDNKVYRDLLGKKTTFIDYWQSK